MFSLLFNLQTNFQGGKVMAKLCVIVGMGEGNGMSIAKRFGKEGFTIAMIARNEEKLKSYQSKEPVWN